MNKDNNTIATINSTVNTAKVAALIGLGCLERSKPMGYVKQTGDIAGRVGTASAAIIGVHAITGTPMYVGVYKALRIAAIAGIATGAACSLASLGYVTVKAVQHMLNGNAKRLAEAAAEVADDEAGEQPAEA